MANILGTNGNDTLSGLNGNTLTGGGGNDIFNNKDNYRGIYTITDFGGIGQGTNPAPGVIAEVDTLIFQRNGLTAQNLLLTQNGSNLEISFTYENDLNNTIVTLQNFALEDLDNLSTSTGATVDLGNIVFYGETITTDSFDVFNANSTQSNIFNRNTVTFLNDLNNNVDGFDDSDDVINGQGGDDIIDGKSGNDTLRGGAGNNLLSGSDGNDYLDVSGRYSYTTFFFNEDIDSRLTGNNTLNGGAGEDTLRAIGSKGNNLLSGGDGNDYLDISGSYSSYRGVVDSRSTGNNTLKGGAGEDTLRAGGSTGDNLLSGGDGNDYLDGSGSSSYYPVLDSRSTGKNTLDGGAGDDSLSFSSSTGDNLLSGGDGNDYLDISGSYSTNSISSTGYLDSRSTGNNILNGGAGDDTLNAGGSTGNNLLLGGDGNDSVNVSGYTLTRKYYYGYSEDYNDSEDYDYRSSGDNILNGGAGDDTLNAGGSTGNNLLLGGDGNDSVNVSGYTLTRNYYDYSEDYSYSEDYDYRSSGNNTLNGGAGNDTLNAGGSTGNNFLSGGDGDDYIFAYNASGNNTLYGGNGNDILAGGSGTDTFGFNSYNEGVDTIYDFNATNELIQVSASGFGGGLSTGSLQTSQFTIGTSATAIAQRFIYDNSTGGLFFDQDGSDTGFAQVKFAQLSTELSLSNNNFVVV